MLGISLVGLQLNKTIKNIILRINSRCQLNKKLRDQGLTGNQQDNYRYSDCQTSEKLKRLAPTHISRQVVLMGHLIKK